MTKRQQRTLALRVRDLEEEIDELRREVRRAQQPITVQPQIVVVPQPYWGHTSPTPWWQQQVYCNDGQPLTTEIVPQSNTGHRITYTLDMSKQQPSDVVSVPTCWEG